MSLDTTTESLRRYSAGRSFASRHSRSVSRMNSSGGRNQPSAGWSGPWLKNHPERLRTNGASRRVKGVSATEPDQDHVRALVSPLDRGLGTENDLVLVVRDGCCPRSTAPTSPRTASVQGRRGGRWGNPSPSRAPGQSKRFHSGRAPRPKRRGVAWRSVLSPDRRSGVARPSYA
jgi:hypothetical protein